MTLDSFNFSKKHNCVWIAPPRTGTRGLTQILNFLGFEYKSKPVFTFTNYNFTHECPSEENLVGIETLISVRNPYGRLYSLYTNYFESQRNVSFRDYVLGLTYKDLEHQAFKYFQIKPTYFVRLENQLEDLLNIPFVRDTINERQLRLMTRHSKEIYKWENEYDDDMKEIVYNLMKNQFENFGYKK